MKNERVLKNFSALSFDGNAVTGKSAPVSNDSQPRLTPESVQDFNVHQDGSAVGCAAVGALGGDKALTEAQNVAGGVSANPLS